MSIALHIIVMTIIQYDTWQYSHGYLQVIMCFILCDNYVLLYTHLHYTIIAYWGIGHDVMLTWNTNIDEEWIM